MAPEQKRRPVRGGAEPLLGGIRFQPYYLTPDGRSIASLASIVAAESARRLAVLSRIAREACQ
jgi:hypothetical protein